MSADLIEFLRARLNEQHAALIRLRDGHEGPCINYADQRPEQCDEYDSCYLQIKLTDATPYSDAAYGLAEVEVKRRIIDEYERYAAERRRELGGWNTDGVSPILTALASVYADHPDFRPEWTQ